MFKLNFLYFSLCPFLLALSVGTTKKSLALTSYFPHQVFIHIHKILPKPSVFLMCHVLQALNHLCSHLLDSLQYFPVSCTGQPSTGPSTPDVSHKGCVERKDYVPQPAGDSLSNGGQEAVDIICHCWIIVNLVSTRSSGTGPCFSLC